MRFSYKKAPAGEYFPVIDFVVAFGTKVERTSALIDSGATISVFKDELAEELGIKIEKGEETYLGGVGGRIKGYIHELEIEVAGKRFSVPVVFSHEYLVSFNLLGRDRFFGNFRIIFEERENFLEIEGV